MSGETGGLPNLVDFPDASLPGWSGEYRRLVAIASEQGKHASCAVAASELALLKLRLRTMASIFAGPGVALTESQRAEIDRIAAVRS